MNLEEVFNKKKLKEYCLDCKADKPFQPALFNGDEIFGSLFESSMTTRPEDLAYLRCLLDAKELFDPEGKKPVFLDLGGGLANPNIYAAHHGWLSYYVDSSKNCYELALKNIENAELAEYIPKNSIKVAHGNFFPKDFSLERLSYEKDHFRKFVEKNIESCPTDDIYSMFGLGLNKVDLFYHFQLERQENILRFFSKYAKPGAMLLFTLSVEEDFLIPDDVIQIGSFGKREGYSKDTLYLYQKINLNL